MKCAYPNKYWQMAADPDGNILDINGMSFDPDTAVENQSAV